MIPNDSSLESTTLIYANPRRRVADEYTRAMRNLAFVGCAHIHTPSFVDACLRRKASVSGVWDHDPARAQATAEKIGCPTRGFDEILTDPAVHAIVVCTETDRHEDIVKQAADAGKAMFVEKPLGIGARDALMMANAVDAAGVLFQTGYRMRGEPAVRTIHRMVGEGAFGTITRARASVCHCGALQGWFDGEWRWMADRSQAGVGAFGDLGTHGLDILLWLLGDVESVSASMGMGTARYPGCEEYGEALIRFRSGAIATLAASWDDVADPSRLFVAGTKRHAHLTRDGLFVSDFEVGFDKSERVEPDAGAHAGFDAFLDWAEGLDANFVGVREAAYRCVVMDAIYRAAETGSVVQV